MIKSDTVFILGAGASVPYGYPTGSGLIKSVMEVASRDEICKAYFQCLTPETKIRIPAEPLVQGIAQEFKGLLSDANPASIDYFLKLRKEYMVLGKTAIAYAIRACAMTPKNFQRDIAGSDWYRYLRDKIFEDTFAETCNNRIAFITFNYDTSLEEYFYKQLELYYPGKNREIFFKNIKIEHVHGKICRMPWEKSELPDMTEVSPKLIRPYNPNADCDCDMLKNMADGIRLYHEGDDDGALKNISQMICGAKKVFFLGFGFHKDNVAKLDLGPLKKFPINRLGMFSTRLGLTDSEWNAKKIESGLCNLVCEGGKADDCLALLKNSAEYLI
jgi:hypothetical protein